MVELDEVWGEPLHFSKNDSCEAIHIVQVYFLG